MTQRGMVRKILRGLKAEGFAVLGVDNGEGWVKSSTESATVTAVFDVDESRVFFQKPGFNRHWVFFVLGNAPDGSEVAADWSFTEGDPDGFSAAMDRVTGYGG